MGYPEQLVGADDRADALKMMREAGWRVMRVRVNARTVLNLIYRQFSLPYYMDFPNLRLPEGYKIVPGTLQLDRWANCWEVLVCHPSFPEVPEGVEPPVFGEAEGQPRAVWEMYALATEKELEARRLGVLEEGHVPDPPAPPVSIRDGEENPFYVDRRSKE